MVEDEASDAELARRELLKGGLDFDFERVDTEEAFVRELRRFRPGVILSDHGTATFDGFSALAIAREKCPNVPFIFVTGSLPEKAAARALRNGASDIVLKDRMGMLTPALFRALREHPRRKRRPKVEDEIRALNEQLEQRVAERTAELQVANEELEAFSHSVSHELRAPLRQVEGYVGILLATKDHLLDDEARRYLRITAAGTRRMANLIHDLLEFSRTARAEIHKTKIDLTAMVRRAIGDLARESAGRRVEWITGDLGWVEGDPSLLRQVIANLLSNALKYTRRRSKVRIEIGRRESTGRTIIFVKDNGVGFDMRHARKLFGVFQRLHPPSEFEGTGIGLANVRQIIHRHGGSAWAEGRINHGATFYFALPRTG